MSGRRTGPANPARGFTTVELLIVVAIIAVLSAIALPELQQAKVRAETRALAQDCRTVHTAFKEYFIDHGTYPTEAGAGAFDLVSFEPLRQEGYFRGGVASKLLGDQADAYDAPNDAGQDQEFWLEMTLQNDPTIRFLVADSDDAPLAGGDAFDGIAVFKNGVRQNL
jgi:prepilin-type N-terminal cleavage/methylation domain-containing protein